MQYEDKVRQEAARKTVPVDELEEKALVSLAKVGVLSCMNFQKWKGEKCFVVVLCHHLLFACVP